MLLLVVFAGVALALSACESTTLPPGQRLKVSPEVMAYYQDYLRDMGSGGNGGGAFAVSMSGHRAAYNYCPAQRCLGGNSAYAGRAITMCEKSGEKCVLFARDSHVLVPYDVVP